MTAYELRISDWSSDVCSSDLDCRGFPPMYLLASDSEVLLDDTVLFARRAKAAGVDVRFEIWPVLPHAFPLFAAIRSEEHTSELQSLMRISYAVFCLKKKKTQILTVT